VDKVLKLNIFSRTCHTMYQLFLSKNLKKECTMEVIHMTMKSIITYCKLLRDLLLNRDLIEEFLN